MPGNRPDDAVVALDGHDGSGKTTLAGLLADRVGACRVRTFGAPHGPALMAAYESGDPDAVIDVGAEAIGAALDAAAGMPVVLDRGWLTVATLVPAELFVARWRLWVPTVLVWCDLPTTLARLGERRLEKQETAAWHAHFLELYMERRQLAGGPIVRTDRSSVDECLDELEAFIRRQGHDRMETGGEAGRP